MSENIPRIAQIIDLLPQKLQIRFESLGGYVRGIIEEENTKLGRAIRLSIEQVQLIQLAALIYSLEDFFRAGSSAARSASIAFEDSGLSGFQVGRQAFTKYNVNTRRGDLLAEQLRVVVRNSPLGDYIKNASSMTLPGCVAVGETQAEVMQLIQEAIFLHLESMRETGVAAPQPRSRSDYVDVPTA